VLKSVIFEVIGDQRLFCDGCERRVERLLKALHGVRQVRAQASNQRIEVLFDAVALDADTIAAGLAEAGYETKAGNSTGDLESDAPPSTGKAVNRIAMAFKQGEVYRCPDPNCGCELTVTKDSKEGAGGNQAPTCFCGKSMEKA